MSGGGGGSAADATVDATVDANPQAPPAISVPANATANSNGLVASVPQYAGASYAWQVSGGTITTGGTGDFVVVAVGDVGTLTLSCAITINGTVTNVIANVNVVAMPIVVIVAPSTAASSSDGLTASVAAQAGMTYAWTISNGTVTAGSTTSTISFSALAAGTLSLTCIATNAAGVSVTGSATVSVVAAPSGIVVSAPSTATTNSSGLVASVASQSGATYAWSISGGTMQAGANASTMVFTAGDVGTLVVTCVVTNGGGSTTASANVAVVAAPTSIVTAPASALAGATGLFASVDEQDGATYAWTISEGTITSDPSSATISFAAGSAGTLTVTCVVVNAAGAAIVGSATVSVVAPPTTPTIVAPSVVSAGSAGLVASISPQAGASYAWTISNGTIAAGSDGTTLVFIAGDVGTLTVFCTVTTVGGASSASADVAVVAPPVAIITAPSSAAANTSGFGASVAEQDGVIYAWSISNGTITTDPSASSITFDTLDAGTLTITCVVINEAGTSATATASVTVVTAPTTPIITSPAYVTAGAISLVASVQPEPGATYEWSIVNGAIEGGADGSTMVFTAGATGTLAVTCLVTTAGGLSSASNDVIVVDAPIATVTAPTAAATGQHGLSASVPTQANVTYAWTIGGGTITSDPSAAQIAFTAGGVGSTQLSCTVTNLAGTTATGSASVTVAAPPSAVTVSAPSNVTTGAASLVASVAAQSGAS